MITKETTINALAKKFSLDNLVLSLSDISSAKNIPAEWQGFGIKEDLTSSAWYPAQWEVYRDRLPWLCTLLKKCLIGTAIFYKENPHLIYIFHDSEDYYCYIGKPPLNYSSSYPATQLQKLPRELIGFYQDLHNGFTFHPSNSMGPLPLEEQPSLINLYEGSHPPFSKQAISIFHNGAGDYLSVDPSTNCQNAFIWWHENPEIPEINLNLWAVMDTWISIFLEDTQILRN